MLLFSVCNKCLKTWIRNQNYFCTEVFDMLLYKCVAVALFYSRGEICSSYIFFFLNFGFLFVYLWLCWAFVSVRGLSLVAASGGHSSSRCAGLSLLRPLLLRSTGSRRAGSVIVLTGLVAPRHVGSSQTRTRTCVPWIGRQILNHCATRDAPYIFISQGYF